MWALQWLFTATAVMMAAGEMVELTDSNWAEHMAKGNPWMIEFYAPWCGQCKKLAPVYEKAADTLGSELVAQQRDGKVSPASLIPRIGRVDCTKNHALATRFAIRQYPMMKVMKNWTLAEETTKMFDYHGELSDVAIPRFLFRFAEDAWRAPVDHVVKLNDSNFDEFVNSNDLTMVMFYDPGCSHCKVALPQFLEASDELHKSGIKIGQIQAKVSTVTAGLYGVKSYPKFKVFRDGIVRDYEGGRTKNDIVDEMAASQRSAVIEINTRYDLERLTESDRHIILAVFETADAPYMMRYDDICMNQRTDFKCYFTTSLHAVSRYPEIGYGTLTVFRSKFLTSKHEQRIFTRKAKGNGAVLKKWIHDTSKTLVGERTDRRSLTGVPGPIKLHYEMYRPMLVVYYDLDTQKDYYGESKAIFEKIADVAKKWNGSVPYSRRFIQRSTTGEHLRFAVARSAEYAETLQRFRHDDSDHDYTAIMYSDTLSEYRQGDDQTLEEFVEAAVEGTMPKYNESAPLPESPASAEVLKEKEQRQMQRTALKEKEKLVSKVVDLNDGNFEEHVKEGDVWMIDFYTPWCKHCHALKPQYERVAKMFGPKGGKAKYQKPIKFGAVNCESGALQLRKTYGITGFPTLKFLKGGPDGKLYEYEGQRNAEDISKHMRAFAKKDWVNPRERVIESGGEDEDDGLFHC